MTMTPGIYKDMGPAEYYRRELGVVSKSALDEFRRSPEHYKVWVEGIEPEPTPALVFGNAVDCALFEPDRFERQYIIAPDLGDGRTKEGKARRAEFDVRAHGRTILSEEDGEHLHAMVARIRENSIVRGLLEDPDGVAQMAVVWVDRTTGLTCKGRLDWYSPRYKMAMDLKTTEDASPRAFSRSIANYGYHRQNAMYVAGLLAHGIELDRFIFAASEKSLPFGVASYWLSPEDVRRGHQANAKDMAELKECLDANEWPGYYGGTIELPKWAA